MATLTMTRIYIWFMALDNVLGPVEIPGLAEQEFVVNEELLLTSGDDEPTSLEEACGDAWWRRALMEEMASIHCNKKLHGGV